MCGAPHVLMTICAGLRNVVNDIKLSPLVYCNSQNVNVYNNALSHYSYNTSLYDSNCNSSLSSDINDISKCAHNASYHSWITDMLHNRCLERATAKPQFSNTAGMGWCNHHGCPLPNVLNHGCIDNNKNIG
jgi:hypothetical protein